MSRMVEKTKKGQADNAELLPDYDDYVFEPDADDASGANGAAGAKGVKTAAKPTAYVGVHSTSFKDMLLKPEL